MGIVGGEDQQHGVPGQTLKTGDTAGLSGEERVTEDHSLLDTSESLQKVLYLCHVSLPDRMSWMIKRFIVNTRVSLRYETNLSGKS